MRQLSRKTADGCRRNDENGGEVAGVSSASDLPTLPLGKDSVTWRVSCEPAFLLPSGPRALPRRGAPPGGSAGVGHPSGSAARPRARLIGTNDVINKLSVGAPEGFFIPRR